MKSRPLFWCSLVMVAAVPGCLPAAETQGGVRIFSPDAGHLWNRLYATLGAWVPEGKEMLQWSGPNEQSLREGTAVLGEFVKSGAAEMSPLQRAVMQRRLLTHFQSAVVRQSGGGKANEAELLALLARSVRQVAMSAEEIRKLPDNYAAAVALPGAVTAYDPAKPAAFLPKDLLADDGPWIGLELTPQGGRQGVVAEFHFQFFKGSKSFEVRMRHPDGRAAGAAYLKKLAEITQPFVPEGTPGAARLRPNGPADAPLPNPETPQFPAGTAWALVHRAIMADNTGAPVVSPLVEGVQMRVYRAGSMEELWRSEEIRKLLDSLKAENKEHNAELIVIERYQTMFEWTMRGTEWLEKKRFHQSETKDTLFGGCIQCHSAPGIHSVNSRSGLFHAGQMTRPPEFKAATRERIDAVTTEAAQALPGWVELRKGWGER